MLTRKIFRSVRPYISAFAVIVVIGMLVFTIYFTELGLQWVTFLTGILIASILAMVSRSSRAEWIITRRTTQVKSLKDKLEQETQLRNSAVTNYQQALFKAATDRTGLRAPDPAPIAYASGKRQHPRRQAGRPG